MTAGAETRTSQGYSTREVARLLEVSEETVRSHVRSGVIDPARGPAGAYRFSFQDLILLRTARSLAEQRVTPARVKRALAQLRERLPERQHLSSVSIGVVNHAIVVREAGALWEPETGQSVMDFEVGELERRVATLGPRCVEPPAEDADCWFARGVELESEDPEEAEAAYVRAVAVDPAHADARLNLGRLLHETDRVQEAEAHYRAALAARPDDATAAFDLGVALEDQGRADEAMASYRRALELDPKTADAHFNLARLLERAGQPAAALDHLKSYRRLTRP